MAVVSAWNATVRAISTSTKCNRSGFVLKFAYYIGGPNNSNIQITGERHLSRRILIFLEDIDAANHANGICDLGWS
ncbi:hypothetical protein K9B33_22950, partial [Sphingobium sp. 3R8]|uniref:hypothetical protein n=1 Tax=Sphingobium sp. 3R8 TaxID=2874921 RepID=UPI001CCE6BCD